MNTSQTFSALIESHRTWLKHLEPLSSPLHSSLETRIDRHGHAVQKDFLIFFSFHPRPYLGSLGIVMDLSATDFQKRMGVVARLLQLSVLKDHTSSILIKDRGQYLIITGIDSLVDCICIVERNERAATRLTVDLQT